MIHSRRAAVLWKRAIVAPLAVGMLATGALSVDAAAHGQAAAYHPSSDAYSMAALTSEMGATAWWNQGYTGAGVDVAIIDSGVSPVAGLNGPGKVIYGPDLSLESQAPNLHNLDTYGHGTFMAGLIAGHDSSLTAPYASAPASAYRGVAPDARILSVKVADADGGTDVTQIIAAIDWVVQHRHDNGMNVRVINLSYGTNSLQSSLTDPLSFAVEQAWHAGIVVVAAAGNEGYQKGAGAPCLADPAYNPYVIAVAATDTNGTASMGDDSVPSYSSSGGALCKNPDFATPGTHVQGLRVPNSYIDTMFPTGRLGKRYFRGSGTSEATALTSGAVALVLQRYPWMTPDQVKSFFQQNAQPMKGMVVYQQGAGETNLAKMATRTPSIAAQVYVPATGLGSIEMARGTDHIASSGVILKGEKDIFGAPIKTSLLASLESLLDTWTGGRWNGNTWTGNTWSGNSWTGNTWSGNSWTGNSWTGGSWSGNSWTGSSWSGNSWTGNSWSGNSWTGNSWASASWH